jgi:hypothetical protein
MELERATRLQKLVVTLFRDQWNVRHTVGFTGVKNGGSTLTENDAESSLPLQIQMSYFSRVIELQF